MKGNSSKLQLKRSARVSSGAFNSKSDCLFCGTVIDLGCSDYSYVKTDQFSRTIHECCESRSDDWSFTVIRRIEYYGDLHAADYIYYYACSVNFRNGKGLPVQMRRDDTVERRKEGGQPKDVDQEQAFLKMYSYLEANDEELAHFRFV